VPGPAALLNHDAWFRTVEGYARSEPSPINRFFWRLEARAVRRYELAAQSAFEWSLFLSEEDRQEIVAGREGLSAARFLFLEDPARLADERFHDVGIELVQNGARLAR